MKLSLTSPLFLYLTFLIDDLPTVHAIRHSLYGTRQEARHPGLGRRVAMAGDLKNANDVKYWTNVTMGGKSVSLLLDTGSSDLTVAGDIPNTKDTGKSAELNYAIGSAKGPIKTVEVKYEGYTVPDQAFVLDQSGVQEDDQGIIGLGPSENSEVRQVMNSAAGNPILDRIFKQSPSTPNFISIVLGRSDDPDNKYPGDLTIGEVLDDYQNITSQPKLPVFDVKANGGQHWQTLIDAKGILGPDGQPVNVTSRVKGSDKNRLNAIFDTGFTMSQVPKAVADAFYLRVPGAKVMNVTGVGEIYTLPCNVELNVTFKFGNVSVPVHPFDTSSDDLGKKDAAGNELCLGGFQPIQTSAESSTYDIILGMTFLRNVYILIDFGDFVDGEDGKTNDPYIQLLPLTQPALAHSDFVETRLDGIDDTSSFQLLPASILPPEEDDPRDDESLSQKLKPYLPYIIAGSVVLGVLLLLGIFFCVKSSRSKRYRRLHDPAPAGMHQQELPFASYQPTRRY